MAKKRSAATLRRPATGALRALLIGRDADSLAALRVYLRGAGVIVRATSALSGAARVGRATTAVVLFPDGYAVAPAASVIRKIRATLPRVLVVLVTSSPQSFRPAIQPEALSTAPLVLPKPAYGWTILDAIRAHVEPPEVANEP